MFKCGRAEPGFALPLELVLKKRGAEIKKNNKNMLSAENILPSMLSINIHMKGV